MTRWVSLVALATALGCGGGESSGDANPPTDSSTDTSAGADATETAPDAVEPDDTPEADEGTPPPDEGSQDVEVPDDDGPDAPEPPPCPAGEGCDDGDPCTQADTCSDDGSCAGEPYACDDGRPCTDDACDGQGDCTFVVAAGACLIANVCYSDGDGHALNPCVACNAASSTTEWSLAADGVACGLDDACLEDGICEAGQCQSAPIGCDDQNPCTDDLCDPAVGCVQVQNFDPCSDGDPCSGGDTCDGGACVPGLLELQCDDDQPCTNDVCGPDGCLFLPKSGACSDGSECSAGDFCEKGKCLPGPPLKCDDGSVCTIDKCDAFVGCTYELVDSTCCVAGFSVCDDQNSCTTDVCDEVAVTCTYVPNSAPCDDGDACTAPDACGEGICTGPVASCDDGNECTTDSCASDLGGCQHVAAEAACDDDNACTTDDGCLGGTCIGAPVSCNDDNGCTADSCLPVPAADGGGCQNVVKSTACSDGNACTMGDTCQAAGDSAQCVGSPLSCDDGNDCTTDSCHPALGCQHIAVGAPCSDGLDCSTGDHCVGGVCVADTSECGCLPTFSDVVDKLTLLIFGENGHPGNGLDVDGSKATCSPSGKCSEGIDNQLAGFAGLANDALTSGFADGGLILLFEHAGFHPGGKTYTLNFLPGKKDKANPGCDVQSEYCTYLAENDGYDPDTCKAMVSFPNAKIVGGKTLKAGGKGYAFPLELPLGDAALPLTLSNAEIEATVTIEDGLVTSMNGVLAGALPKSVFIAGIDAVEEKDLPEGLGKDLLKQLIEVLIQNDIDTDGDGSPDAASIGLKFTSIAGGIVGVK